MKRFFLVLTFLTLCLLLLAGASADSAPMQLMRMNPLAFSKQPTRIESVTPTPDGWSSSIRRVRPCCPPRWGKPICWRRVRRIRADR